MTALQNEAPHFAFVDEYGDTRLATEEQSASTYFIITAVIIDETEVDAVRKAADVIRARHFQKGEMKSSSIKDNDNRRIRILQDIATLKFHFYSLAVDKRSIHKDSGLSFKNSFLKFIHGMLYGTLYRRFFNLHAISDNYGRKEFMDGFIQYVERNKILDLFRKSKFSFQESKSEPLLQVADLIAGTLGRVFDPKKTSMQAGRFLEILEPKALRIEEWPPSPRPAKPDIWDKVDSPQDHTIRTYCLRQASIFLHERVETRDETVRYQVETLKHLLYVFTFIDPQKYISTSELKNELVTMGLPPIDTHALRTNIIARLRDAGVILASSQQGYKIPHGLADVRDFVEHGERIVVPMLNRIQAARDHILTITKREVDILSGDKYEGLRMLLKSAGDIRKSK